MRRGDREDDGVAGRQVIDRVQGRRGQTWGGQTAWSAASVRVPRRAFAVNHVTVEAVTLVLTSVPTETTVAV
jgi:hypothetical protein